MAESTLALTRTEIKQVLGVQAGWGETPGSWSTKQSSQIDRSIKRGLRMAYFPPPNQFAPDGYQWNFLKPTSSLTIFNAIKGTQLVFPTYDPATGLSLVASTVSNTFYPTVIGQTFTFDTSGNGYVIAGYTSSQYLTLTGDASGEASYDTFTITPDYSYRLPDDFAYILGVFTYPATSTAFATVIQETNEGQIRSIRQRSTTSGQPTLFSIRPVDTDGSSGQRFEVLFWPDVDAVYTLQFRYSVLPDLLVDTTNEYPYGGASHGELFLNACRAALDMDLNDRKGVYWEDFLVSLQSSIARDMKFAPKVLGYMGPGRRGQHYGYGRRAGCGNTTFTVNGTDILL